VNNTQITKIVGDQAITIFFTYSPSYKPCIAMNIPDCGEWMLLTTRRNILATALQKHFLTEFHITSILGLPLDWRESIESGSFVLEKKPGCVGLYVPADQFDRLVNIMDNL
jgi:hypothetical protein